MPDPRHIVRAGAPSMRGRHPFNPNSEMTLTPLGDAAGLTRLGVNLIRIPPGRESFIPHAHTLQEEFVYVLSGAGEVVLDGKAHPIGPGDFVGFPTDGVVHNLKSLGPEDLVYLTAGERTAVEIADMPTIGRTTVTRNGAITMLSNDGAERFTMEEWFARVRLDEEAKTEREAG